MAATTGTFYGQAMTAGDIYTVAGDGKRGDGGPTGFPATQAELDSPDSVAVDRAGDLLLTEGGGQDERPDGARQIRNLLRRAHDRGRHLQRRRRRETPVFRGRRPGSRCGDVPDRDIGGRGRQPC